MADVNRQWVLKSRPSGMVSESCFEWREAPMPEDGLSIFVSQSGETLDTLEALRYCKRQGQSVLSIVNK